MLVSAPVRIQKPRPVSPVPSDVSMKSDKSMGDLPNFNREPPRSDPKLQKPRSVSPVPSHVSMKSDCSIGEPPNFSREPPQSDLKLQKPRSVSPVPSCLSRKSDRSLWEQPNFSREPPHSGPSVKMEKSDSPAPSCVSYQSMDLPQNFTGEFEPNPRLMKLERFHSPELHSVDSEDMKRESITPDHASELAVSLLTNEDFKCSVCTGVLKEPVSIPCGHSYCKQCITSYWEQPSQTGHYACPQCPRTYSSHPALYSNSALALVVHKLEHFSPVLPAQSRAGPGDVECDFCNRRKLKAVKTCLNCTASFCSTHVKDHYTIPALQRHTLVEAVETMEEKMIHTELKEPHRSDSDESPSSSRKRHGQEEDPVLRVVTSMQQEMRQLKRQVSDLQDTISTFDCKVRKEEKNISREQQDWQLRAQQLLEVWGQQQELTQQLLEAQEQQQEQQQQWRMLGLRSDPYMWKQLQEAKQQEAKEKLTQPVSDGQALIAEPVTREDFLQYSCHFTLDPNTAHRVLHLSEGNRRVEMRPWLQSYPRHPDRFDERFQVLCREGVSARCYWEVEWSGEWVGIAVSYKSISRKGYGNECQFGHNDQSWSLYLTSWISYFTHNNEETKLPLVASSRIGVYVDHRAGTLAFYSISGDTMTLLHRVRTTFTHTLYPGFGFNWGSSVKLL